MKGGADVSVKVSRGKTVLMAACEAGSFEICEVLVKAGVDVEVLRQDGATALGLSLLSSNWTCVDLCMRRLLTTLVSGHPAHPAPFVVVSDLCSWHLFICSPLLFTPNCGMGCHRVLL